VRKIPLEYIQPEMKVAQNVYSSDSQILLTKGAILKDSYLQQLRFFDIAYVYVEDGFSNGIEVEDVINEKTRIEAMTTVKELLSDVKNQMSSGKGIMINSQKLQQSIQDIIAELFENRKLLVNLVDIRTSDSYTFAHSVNVAVLALITGIGLGLHETQLKHLAMAAMLHDIGKTCVPDEILNKKGSLTPEEMVIMQKHTEFGKKILSCQPNLSIFCGRVAYEHHEKMNGSGYPRGLKDDDIHLFSKITSIVDVYDAITSNRSYHSQHLPHEGYEYLSACGGSIFDYDIVTTFLRHVACYPVGTIVQISSGEIGIVVDTPKNLTTRPEVRVLFHQNKWVNKPYSIRLIQHHNKVIAKVFTEPEFLELVKKYQYMRQFPS
jgi:HD-GYP domain-containing protein (c-di-GMP phosphodiesterase class II)